MVNELVYSHMISSGNIKNVHIHITTYHTKDKLRDTHAGTAGGMNENRNLNKRNQNPKFICSICLNSKPADSDNKNLECEKRKSKSCPICKKSCDLCANSGNNNCVNKNRENDKTAAKKAESDTVQANAKVVQTSQTDVSQGLNLLNEVLTVFQSKKRLETKMENGNKTVILKDACVATDKYFNSHKPKLTVSKLYQFSVEEQKNTNENGKFTIIDSREPEKGKMSDYSIDLIKHKSSSIPQMKLDELKNSLKPKTKSKDAIEEVNRMFATVKKNDIHDSLDDTNRPMIRSGPRVLPVVKTPYEKSIKKEKICSNENVSVCSKNILKNQICQCCQTNNYYLSGGDSFIKKKCCHETPTEVEKCDKCVYMLCCHYQNHRQMQTGIMICERCRNTKLEEFRCRHDHNQYDDSHYDDNGASF